jgi:hypothetical protein
VIDQELVLRFANKIAEYGILAAQARVAIGFDAFWAGIARELGGWPSTDGKFRTAVCNQIELAENQKAFTAAI